MYNVHPRHHFLGHPFEVPSRSATHGGHWTKIRCSLFLLSNARGGRNPRLLCLNTRFLGYSTTLTVAAVHFYENGKLICFVTFSSRNACLHTPLVTLPSRSGKPVVTILIPLTEIFSPRLQSVKLQFVQCEYHKGPNFPL